MLSRSISSSFAAKRRIISSGGTGGASGLFAGMGVGRATGAAGLSGPACCACAGILAEANNARMQETAVMMESRLISGALIHNSFDAIHACFVAWTPGGRLHARCYLLGSPTVHRRVNSEGAEPGRGAGRAN